MCDRHIQSEIDASHMIWPLYWQHNAKNIVPQCENNCKNKTLPARLLKNVEFVIASNCVYTFRLLIYSVISVISTKMHIIMPCFWFENINSLVGFVPSHILDHDWLLYASIRRSSQSIWKWQAARPQNINLAWTLEFVLLIKMLRT